MKKILLLLPVLLLLLNPKVQGEITEGKRKLVAFIRKALAYVSGFLMKRAHDRVDFTILEEDG